MIHNLKLSNFKCFETLDLTCAPLTILCGLNGMGKSSVIQALLVLRQSIDAASYILPDELILGGSLTDLGTGADVLYEDAHDNTLAIEVRDDQISQPYGLRFEYVSSADRLLTIQDSQLHDWGTESGWDLAPPVGGDLFYVNAERIGPRKHYPYSETAARRRDMGVRSELALSYWNSRRTHAIADDDPRRVGLTGQTCEAVLDSWLASISPGAHLDLETIPDADALLARFFFDRPRDVPTRPYRATNVGFGLSYTLPVLIALLAPKGTLCLIENPEAHLHPRGQTKVAELAARAASAGTQVVVETHSDHFLDGVRIAVHDGVISSNRVAIHYFQRDGAKAVVSSPRMEPDGRLSSWPAGFFDQHEENLSKLLAPRQ